jgi:hypothetical protein
MTLDARRTRAVDTSSDRLRQEITRERRMMTDELADYYYYYCRDELVRALPDGDANLLVDLSAA